MIFDARNNAESVLASSTAWLPLVYDTVVIGLTFYRTYPSIRGESRSKIAKRLLEDGLLYYSVIFSVTLALTLMIVFAPDGLKNVAAQLELLITFLNLGNHDVQNNPQSQEVLQKRVLLQRLSCIDLANFPSGQLSTGTSVHAK
ncbi:hypothetical protein E1B28_003700 [Marasmius oreades]|uniref:Uncharacterized protein n=1 Tax=Marasmius oreades TaxID=181124 RepID=A0A9P8AB32_9AGAR|nr:uncharacterized protein E1B28_003700 [Marasmius oreades]KAG7096252.1 hypothetical protein E1B28_003700 [Marasmius oreades]